MTKRRELKFTVVNKPSGDDIEQIADLLRVKVQDRRSKTSYGVWPMNVARRKFR